MQLSILDLVSVRSGQNTSQALEASIGTARFADAAGFTRYWVAEHHNMPAVASTNPAILAGILAARTERIRVGSGGVMLPNHAPLVVAEQFALLEAAYPGRVDLGIGRAPGSDPVVTAVLNRSGATSDVNQFPQYVDEILGLLQPEGIAVKLSSGREYELKATPEAASVPMLWLLGSSDYSARLAAENGLPYVFANHFGGMNAAPAMAQYRTGFKPSDILDAPRTFMTINAIAADTTEEAEARALPQLVQMSRLRSNKPMTKMLTVEEAAAEELSDMEREIIAGMRQNWIIGDGDFVAGKIREFAAEHAVDEVMISPGVGEDAATAPGQAPARIHSLKLISDRLLG
ncbi:LLM class flavin-dependent oxidoreductase [Mycetocola spongiae]|uniref:LLM class flavin-dependent oxidoreductase n=1 Tax=Mycetocola spongiae TaxID=2859226 RepID=UPI001CF5AA95|nr:LLM class flavin-dependent oxidoreductase [Mycetocola spongiae]